MTITNSTNEDLSLVSATHDGPGSHRHAQAKQTLKVGASEIVTDYSGTTTAINPKALGPFNWA